MSEDEGPVRFRTAAPADLGFVLATEEIARRAGFVGGWPEAEHRRAMSDPDAAYRVLEAEPDGRSIGYLILRGLENPHRGLELKRITLSETGRGYGRHALRLVKRLAFRRFGAHRLWLDVFEHNARARRLYESEGFVVEGTLRECVAVEGGYASLVVMSVLEREYEAGVAGRHPPA